MAASCGVQMTIIKQLKHSETVDQPRCFVNEAGEFSSSSSSDLKNHSNSDHRNHDHVFNLNASSIWSRLRMDDPKETRWWVIVMILTVEICERISCYTVLGSAGTLLTHTFGLSPPTKSSMMAAFTQLSYTTPLLAGIVADTWFGNMWTGLVCGILYLIGEIFIALSVIKDREQLSMFLVGLFGFVVLGTGLKSVLMNFGAQQIVVNKQTSSAKYALTRERFFQSWYTIFYFFNQ